MTLGKWIKVGASVLCLLGAAVIPVGLPLAQDEPGTEAKKDAESDSERADRELNELRKDLEDTRKQINEWEDKLGKAEGQAAKDLAAELDELKLHASQNERRIKSLELERGIQEVEARISEQEKTLRKLQMDHFRDPDDDKLAARITEEEKKLKDMRGERNELSTGLENLPHVNQPGYDPVTDFQQRLRDLEAELSEFTDQPEKRKQNEARWRTVVRETGALRHALNAFKKDPDYSDSYRPDPDRPVNMNFKKAPIQRILYYVSLRTGIRMSVEGETQTRFTAVFKDALPREMLRTFCADNGLLLNDMGDAVTFTCGPARLAKGHAAWYDWTAKVAVEYDDMALSDVLMDVQRRFGVGFEWELSAGKDPGTSISLLMKVGIGMLMQLLEDNADVRILGFVDRFVVRPPIDQLSEKQLKDELAEVEAKYAGIELLAAKAPPADKDRLEDLVFRLESDLEDLREAVQQLEK